MKITRITSKLIIQLFFLCSFLIASSASHASLSFSNFIVFGDSLADAGNINAGLPDLPSPPYYMNRISNGRVAVDYVSESIGFGAHSTASERGGNNYAFAGGKIAGTGLRDLSAQVDSYLDNAAANADSSALYFVMLGGNDLRGLRSQTSSTVAHSLVNAIVDIYIQQLTRLSNAGAQHFFIPNLPDIGRIPETLMRETNDPGIIARTTSYTQFFNTQLTQALNTFAAQTGADLVQFDLFAEFNNIIDSANSLGITNTTTGYLDDLFSNADNFVFFDDIHPTRKTNSIIGPKMAASIAVSFNAPSTKTLGYLPAILQLLLDD